MAISSIKADQKELAIEQLELQVDLIDDGRRRAAVVLPPAQEVRKLSGKPVQTRRIAFKAEELSDVEARSAQAEFDRLYSNYYRYRNAPTYLARLSTVAQLAGKPQLAFSLAEEAVTHDNSPQLRFRFADIMLHSDQPGGTKVLRELAASGNTLATLRLIELALINEDWEQAETIVSGLLDADYQDWRTHLVAGTIALWLGRYEQAIHHFRVAQEDRPRSAAISQNIAIAHYALGNSRHAIKALRRAVSLNPFKESALALWADVLIQEKLPATRNLLAHVERFLEHYPESSSIAGRAADLYLLADCPKRGVTALRTVQETNSTPSLWNNLGVLYWSDNKLHAAQQCFFSAIRNLDSSDSNFKLVAANAVTVLLEAGQSDTVRELAQSILGDRDIRDAVADHNLARVVGVLSEALFRMRDYEEVLPLIKAALSAQTIQRRLFVQLTSQLVCYYALVEGDYEMALQFARQEFDASTEIDEGIVKNTALNNLTFVLLELGYVDEARENLKRLRYDLSDSAIALATTGLFQLRIGAVERGEASYRRAISEAPSQALAASLRQKFNLEMARYWLNRDRAKALRFARSAQKVKSKDTGWDHRKMRADIRAMLAELEHAH